MGINVRVIKSEREHEVALRRYETLLGSTTELGSEEDQERELLELVLKVYENEKVPRPQVDALSALKFRMEQQGLTNKDLIPYLGSAPRVSEVLSGERPLSLAMMRKLHKGLGIPAAALLTEPSDDYGQSDELPDYDWSKFPIQEMFDRKLFPSVSSRGELKQNVGQLIPGFLRATGAGARTPLLRAPIHQSGSRAMDGYALLVWTACVIRKAQKYPPRGTYKQGVITSGWLRDLAKLSAFDNGPRLAHEYLSKHGICLVFEEHFKKTYLDGAAMLHGAMPVVALTLRHDRADNFWFALLHECVHVGQHLNPDRLFIADNLEDKSRISEKQEEEADQGAQDALIPPALWKSARVRQTHSSEDALDLAERAGIHPCIVAGRVRHVTENWRLLSGLIAQGGSVREHFRDQLQNH